MRRLVSRLAGVAGAALLVVATGVALPAPPAHADSRVTVAGPDGEARVDPTYATTLRVSGAGFQAVRGGFGGIYVFFGTVRDGWQPSRGGSTGEDYLYVPDSESADNQGFQAFVAFPGSDTASSAQATMAGDGSWSIDLVVPGAVFDAVDRAGETRTVDCRRVTCGVITVGAHGVVNARNETFTPVEVAPGAAEPTDGATEPTPAATGATDDPAAPGTDPAEPAEPGSPTVDASSPAASAGAAGPAVLEVDRASAYAGRALSFTASGLPVGGQVTVVLDDGLAAAGPFQVGVDGSVAGVVSLPVDLAAGTHELRVFGVEDAPTVNFAVVAETEPAAAETTAADSGRGDRAAMLFACAAALVLLAAVARLVLVRRRSRRAS